jgi:hypothetical protein
VLGFGKDECTLPMLAFMKRINCATCWSNIWTKLFTCWQKHLLFKRTYFIMRSSQLGKSRKCKLILSLSKLCPCISWNWTSLVGMYISFWLFTKIWMWWVGLWVAFGKLCIQKCKVGFISWCWVDLLKIVPKPHWLARWFLGLILITWCKFFLCAWKYNYSHEQQSNLRHDVSIIKRPYLFFFFFPMILDEHPLGVTRKKMQPIITCKDLGGRCY